MSLIPRIAIIGAGPGGLTLANILQRNGIPFTIYDLEAGPKSRNQGGTLDLHPQGGQLALKEAGLWDAFTQKARPESDVMKIVKNNGEVLWDGNGPDAREIPESEKFANRPEIDRTDLKEILLSSLDPTSIQWGRRLDQVLSPIPLQYDLKFSDGSIEKNFDLVVGADGAWSKVRRLLTDVVPEYSGISLVELWALNVDENHQWMSQYAGQGSCFSFGEGRTIQIQRNGDGSIRTYGCLRKPENFLQFCGIDWTKPETARKEYVRQYFDDCGEDLKRMMLESSDALIPRTLYELPVGFQWISRPGITLLGDAAHLMTPFAGVGVNAAMLDALELARAIVSLKDPSTLGALGTVIGNYEKELFPRAAKFAQKTMQNKKKHFSATGSEEMAGRLRAAYGGQSAR